MLTFQPDEAFARHLDATDPLSRFRDQFHLPRQPDPSRALRTIRARPGQECAQIEDIEEWLETHGHEVAVVVWNAVNFLTGQFFDVARLVAAAKRQGCAVGLDLAHAAGNVPLALHDW